MRANPACVNMLHKEPSVGQKDSGESPLSTFFRSAFLVPAPPIGIGEALACLLGRAMRPDKHPIGDAAKLRGQAPWLRQMVEQAATIDRVEPAKLSKVDRLEIGLDEIDVANLQDFLDDLRTGEVCGPAFDTQDLLDTRPLGQPDSMTALERAQFKNPAGVWKCIAKEIKSRVVKRIERSAVIMLADAEPGHPRRVLGKCCGHQRIGHGRR